MRQVALYLGVSTAEQTVGVDLCPHQQGLDTTTPSGKAMFQMLGVFAELGRSMISSARTPPGCG
jgi:Resolvase, N terminal domain